MSEAPPADSPEVFDVVVLGAGPAGENVAQYATEHTDLTAVLIERELLGGECSYYACMPSKALLRPIEVAATAANLAGVTTPALDLAGLLARRDEWVSHYDDAGQVSWAEGAGLSVLRGSGRLVGERLVQVDTADGPRMIEARHAVVIATGSEPNIPAMYADCAPWGSREATSVTTVPERLIIVGGGVVACEAAVWMAAMGSRVTMVVRDEALLTRMEPFAGELVHRALTASGVEVLLGATVTDARRDGAGVAVTVDGRVIEADHLLVATGRKPRLLGLGLESVDLTPAQVTEGRLPPWLSVVGDASGEAPLTHWGKYRARVIGEQIAARALGVEPPQPPRSVPVPQVVFTDPPVASVGLTEAEARQRVSNVVVATVDWTAAAGAALLRDNVDGAASVVVDADSGRLLGATFVGPGAGELLHSATIVILAEVPVHLLRHAVPSYPTAGELWLRLLEALPRSLRRPTG